MFVNIIICIILQNLTLIININKIMSSKPVKVDPLMSHTCNMNEVNTTG